MSSIDLEIDKKIEEFFFGPGKPIKEYNELFKKNNPGDEIRRSPLLVARRDIYYCFGMNAEDSSHTKELFADKIKFGPAYFAGIWLIWETLVTLAMSTGIDSWEKASQNDFIAKLLKIKTGSAVALRKLRNAITHINYGLRYRDESNELWQFNLSNKSKYLIKKNKKSKYPSNNYIVNPIVFHQKFEKGLSNFKSILLDITNEDLRITFNDSDTTKRCNWVRFV